MGTRAFVVTYVLALIGAGLLSIVKPPLQYFGAVLLGLAFLLPLASRVALGLWITREREEQRIMRLLEAGLVRSPHILSGGAPVDYYVDLDQVIATKDGVHDLVELYTEGIRIIERKLMERGLGRIDKLAFPEKASGPVGALTLMGLLEERTGIPSVAVRLRRRLPRAVFKGASPEENDTVVIISDVAASGSLIMDTAKRIRSAGAKVAHALVFYYTTKEVKRVLDNAGINLDSVASPDLLTKLEKSGEKKNIPVPQ